MAIFLFVLQLKLLGGFRKLALLARPNTIWAKARMRIVREWAITIPRAYFAAGAARSTEDAVGRLLTTVEAQDDDCNSPALGSSSQRSELSNSTPEAEFAMFQVHVETNERQDHQVEFKIKPSKQPRKRRAPVLFSHTKKKIQHRISHR